MSRCRSRSSTSGQAGAPPALTDEGKGGDRFAERVGALRITAAPISQNCGAPRHHYSGKSTNRNCAGQEQPVPRPLRFVRGMCGIDYCDHCGVVDLVEASGLELALELEVKVVGYIDVATNAAFLEHQLRRAPPLPVLIIEVPLPLFLLLQLHLGAIQATLHS